MIMAKDLPLAPPRPTDIDATGWNLADLFEQLADRLDGEPAIIEATRTISWRTMDRRADRLARHLLDQGLGEQARVAVCAHNRAAFLETYLACFKAGLVPFNVNYRYQAKEIAYLLDNGDAEAVVADAVLSPVVLEATGASPGVRTTVWIADDDAPSPDPEADYETIVSRPTSPHVRGPWGRSPAQWLFQYTGGTTGMPKAAVWRQCDLVDLLAGTTTPPGEERLDARSDIVGRVTAPARRSLTASPLMHGTGLLSQLANMMTGGCMVVAPGRGFDAAATIDTIAVHRVEVLVIVGDTFSHPLLTELDRVEATTDLTCLKMITSAGAMWSEPVKAALLAHLPWVALYDAFGSSEASGLGISVSTAENRDGTASFKAGEDVRVLGDDGSWVEPGSPTAGRVAIPGVLPTGYHKDPDRSKDAFPLIDGVRYAVPGDYVTWDADGTLTLLGRGSSCINTGGEKVYPEEVEEVLKEHAAVLDAGVIGVPDPKFGQAVVALVELRAAGSAPEAELIAHVRSQMAGYKTPKRIIEVPSMDRHPNGKLDHKLLERTARRALDLPAPAASNPASPHGRTMPTPTPR